MTHLLFANCNLSHFIYLQFATWYSITQNKPHYGSVALLSPNTLKWSAILGLSFFCVVLVAQGIRATGFKHAYWISHFTFKSANTLALCQSKATLPFMVFFYFSRIIYSNCRSLVCHWLSLVASFKAFTATIWTFWVIHSSTLPFYWWWLDVSFSLLPSLDAVAPLKSIIAWH